MKRAAFCPPVFRIRWIHSCLFEKARRSVWPQRRMCPLALQFLVFRDGGTQCIVNHGCLAQQWVITLQKEWREGRRRGREMVPQLGPPERFLPAETQFALQSPGFYLLDNQAPHWGWVLQERPRKRQRCRARGRETNMKTCPCVYLWMNVSLGSRCDFLFGSWKLWPERLWNIKLTSWETRKDISFPPFHFFCIDLQILSQFIARAALQKAAVSLKQ